MKAQGIGDAENAKNSFKKKIYQKPFLQNSQKSISISYLQKPIVPRTLIVTILKVKPTVLKL